MIHFQAQNVGTEIDHDRDRDFWEDLLDFIEYDNVLPIVGRGITTIAPTNDLLYPWLAARLADRLGVDERQLPVDLSLHDVVCQHLLTGGRQSDVCPRLYRILRDDCPDPGETLKHLVSIDKLKLFISTTFDPLLVDALNEVRFGGEKRTKVCSYQPNDATDLPARKANLQSATVFHILGKLSPDPRNRCVAWEGDMLDFILGLHQHMPVLPNLASELKDTNQHYLILGLDFSDLLMRFFMRTARQLDHTQAISRIDYLADSLASPHKNGLVVYFGSLDRTVKVISCDPKEFVVELAKRWHSRKADSPTTSEPPAPSTSTLQAKAQGFLSASVSQSPATVFLSYAHEDREAADRLRSGLETYGIRVWFDQQSLRPATDYAHEIKHQIEEHCCLFISMISRSTESQVKSFFHLERNWAASIAERWSDYDRAAFYLPVIIDDLAFEHVRREPRMFETSQRVRLLDGAVTKDFADRVAQLVVAYNQIYSASSRT